MKKTLLVVLALLTALSLMLGACAPAAEDETPASSSGAQAVEKSFTVIVVHKDGTEKTFNYTTAEENLGPALVKEGLIVESNSPGMYSTVDGETADWNTDQSYWAFYVGSEYAMQGMDDTAVNNGDTFKLVYTIG